MADPDQFGDNTAAERICLVDVGAAGGLQPIWRALGDRIRPVAFEPNPQAAAELRTMLASHQGALVIERGLFSEDGQRTLYKTKVDGCSSVFPPNKARLKQYDIAPAFDVVWERTITCSRYDTLCAAGQTPPPDVIKIDVQGAELDVLLGFGGLLTGCLGIELETHMYPIYEGQGVFGDIVAYLDRFGFGLRRMDPHFTFDAEAVEFDVFFTKRLDRLPAPAERALRKLAVIDQVWKLGRSEDGARMAAVANREYPPG
jgi:FkbM family methyltransferase